MESLKSHNEDILEIYLYPRVCYTSPETVTESLLTTEISKLNSILETFTKDYMWHCDSLIFKPRTRTVQLLDHVINDTSKPAESSMLPHIHARLRFDEDIGDEWFSVYLIFKLTETLEGLIARLVDSDGEFLLIEAADHLPTWAEPERCQNQVFVVNGQVHVINDKSFGRLEQLMSLNKSPQNYLLSRDAQLAVRKRLDPYPGEIGKRRHKARAFLPEKAASILAQEPGLIAYAIRTIVHSDPVERRVCRAMRYFSGFLMHFKGLGIWNISNERFH